MWNLRQHCAAWRFACITPSTSLRRLILVIGVLLHENGLPLELNLIILFEVLQHVVKVYIIGHVPLGETNATLAFQCD